MRHKLVAKDTFIKVIKVTNCLMTWRMALESTALSLSDLEQSSYWNVINCTSTFHTTKYLWLLLQYFGAIQTHKA